MFRLSDEMRKQYAENPEILEQKKQLWILCFGDDLKNKRAEDKIYDEIFSAEEQEQLNKFRKKIDTLCSFGYSLEDKDFFV